ncbi:MAG: D-glycero-beta-D-manno-heptose-7-phosphate kinase [Desulfobacteraceae bacterium 4572_87]|nr:MAG: D-glycero-beta-D-manno-heptose-7-phosphate kinase [Desulfobacteraceae bacterium 4572_87]
MDRFPNARIAVLGDIIMDEFIWGDVSRISPEAPVPVVDVERETRLLGGAANVVRNMGALGADAILCGIVGDDAMGAEIVSELKRMGLRSDGVAVENGRPTSIKTRVVAQNQQIVRYDRESTAEIQAESVQKMLDFASSAFPDIDAVVISDYGKGLISEPLMKGLKSLKGKMSMAPPMIVTVDPKTGNFEHYAGVDVITPNHHEAGHFCGIQIVDEITLKKAGRKMLDALHCRSVLITQGKDGMTLFERDGEITHIPTVAKKVFDVTGAGDTVISAISLGLAVGMDLKAAAYVANIAAGIVVGEVGTSAATADAVKTAIMTA